TLFHWYVEKDMHKRFGCRGQVPCYLCLPGICFGFHIPSGPVYSLPGISVGSGPEHVLFVPFSGLPRTWDRAIMFHRDEMRSSCWGRLNLEYGAGVCPL